ncbi:MAG TPA: succinate dehydrogenase [Candidatus Binatia bacterium]|jgi:succinate dehydrogenase / fumarate reductase cytochrome b subunit|nr:succinate dehydrogenase [Candidatus Binatia bacterium]
MTPDRRDFVLRRLHSLSGIVPIGAYLVVHIFLENSFILAGAARFDLVPKFFATLPGVLLLAVEICFLWGPILFHGLYGLVRVYNGELDTAVRQDWVGAKLYSLQRISGVVAFLFIGYHVWSTRIAYYLDPQNVEISYAFMHAKMTDPLVFTAYLVGVLAAVFHFTNGIWTFCVTWGITVGQRAQHAARALAMLFFVVMYGTAFAIIMAFRA